ncbi:hypothetical protein ABZV67_30860 [Streptomyces sp. NPDC005065]|uniref:hypothetical protein n=1 Tax=unclassified Streptomyces TaxID=2593676 RepID=UPI0033B3C930
MSASGRGPRLAQPAEDRLQAQPVPRRAARGPARFFPSPPTAAELALAAKVSRCGLTVTPHQLERWRAKRWLAPADQWTDPATSALRPDIVHRAAWLAALSRPGGGISWIGWTFWVIDDTEQSAALLRQAPIRGSNAHSARCCYTWASVTSPISAGWSLLITPPQQLHSA